VPGAWAADTTASYSAQSSGARRPDSRSISARTRYPAPGAEAQLGRGGV